MNWLNPRLWRAAARLGSSLDRWSAEAHASRQNAVAASYLDSSTALKADSVDDSQASCPFISLANTQLSNDLRLINDRGEITRCLHKNKPKSTKYHQCSPKRW
jgi:hypothetical protein